MRKTKVKEPEPMQETPVVEMSNVRQNPLPQPPEQIAPQDKEMLLIIQDFKNKYGRVFDGSEFGIAGMAELCSLLFGLYVETTKVKQLLSQIKNEG